MIVCFYAWVFQLFSCFVGIFACKKCLECVLSQTYVLWRLEGMGSLHVFAQCPGGRDTAFPSTCASGLRGT